jgi:hypothetical protein
MKVIRLFAGVFFIVKSVFAQQPQEGELYTPLEQGRFKGTERVGIWNYYDHPARVSLTIDYSNGEILYFQEDSSAYVILENGKLVESRLARPCRFHGSYIPLFDHYRESVEVPYTIANKAEKTKTQIEALLTFEVGEDGVAKNPKLIGDPGVGVPRAMMKAFESAPNSWIPGIKEDGNPATCVFGIKFQVCVDSCQGAKSPEAKVLFGFGTTVVTKASKRDEFLTLLNENQGISYSPDNKRILAETRSLGYQIGTPVGLLADRQTGQATVIPFSNINGCTWLDSDRVYFKYSLKSLPNLPAIYSISSGRVKTLSDSNTYFNLLPVDLSRIAFATRMGNGSRVWVRNLETGTYSIAYQNPVTKYIPISWSPNKDKLLISGREEGISQTIIVDLTSMNRTIVPLFDPFISGWSLDQRILYLCKVDLATGLGKLFSYNTESGLLAEPFSKIKNLSMALYSPEAGKFAVIMKGDAYLLDPKTDSDPVKIKDGVVNLGWNRTGKLLCMVAGKDHQLYEYDLDSKLTRKITSWTIK